MKTSKVLTIAKKYVSRDMSNNAYICIALGIAADKKEIPHEDCQRMRREIHRLLGRHTSLGQWLLNVHNIDVFADSASRYKLQVTRHAWLDHLIAHYKSLGD